jgi:hypothetical protein
MATAFHLNDTRTGGDRVIDLGFRPGGSQRLDGGKFFLVGNAGIAILDAAAWFSAHGPTATPQRPGN